MKDETSSTAISQVADVLVVVCSALSDGDRFARGMEQLRLLDAAADTSMRVMPAEPGPMREGNENRALNGSLQCTMDIVTLRRRPLMVRRNMPRGRAFAGTVTAGVTLLLALAQPVIAAPSQPHKPLPPGVDRPSHPRPGSGGIVHEPHKPLPPRASRPIHFTPPPHGGRPPHRPH